MTVQMTVEQFCTTQHQLLGLSHIWLSAAGGCFISFVVGSMLNHRPAVYISFLVLSMFAFIVGFYYLVKAPKIPYSAAAYCTHENFPELY